MESNENFDIVAKQSSSVGSLSNLDREYLAMAAYWAKFLGIMGYILSGIIVIIAIVLMLGMGMGSMLMEANPIFAQSGLLMTVGLFYLALAGIHGYVAHHTYNFGAKTSRALNYNSDDDLTTSLKSLKSVFRTFGIMTAIIVGFYAVIIVIGIIAAVAMR